MTTIAPPQTPQATPEPAIAPQTLALARGKVRDMLSRAEGFQRLSPQEQVEIANKMVKVAGYMADPDRVLSADGPLASSLRNTDRAVANTARRSGADQGFAGQDFVGGAIRQGTEEFGNLVDTVDFPEFVGGLIENVFQSIVQSSIQQMRAYGEMLQSVSQSVDDFASQNITSNNARDWLMETYPDTFDLNEGGGGGSFGFGGGSGGPTLVAKGDNAEGRLRDISGEIGLAQPITDISDPEAEGALVQGARRSIAKSRMQLLASMVMLGISRIVVTDGQIRAKVVFGMRGSDVAARNSRASTYDRQRSGSKAGFGVGFVGALFGGGGASRSSSHVTTVSSSLDERSQSQAELKAQLSGDVRVNFKSDYMPMAELATPQMIAAIQGNAAPVTPPNVVAPQSTGDAASGQAAGTGSGEG